ncbi:STAS domain-containing protein [Actinophytocola sp.]|uniref:STAS domain-containing protein n=1 Tax=Actinophytocola sp. TaxID=1872138 RepID=UPI002ED4DE74
MAATWPFDLPFKVDVRPLGEGVVLVSVAGEIDIATVGRLRTTLTPLSSDVRVRLLVCDLSEVSFFGCGAVSVLLAAKAALMTRGARLRIVAARNVVLRPLSVMGLLGELSVRPDVRSALG